jgi:hypothetical protein
LTFLQTLALVMVLIVCYIFLNCLHIFKQTRHSQNTRGAEKKDIETIYSRSFIWLITGVAAVIFIAAVVALIASGLSALIKSRLADTPWNLVLAGLSCIIILAGYLYWLGIRKNSGS